MRHDHLLEPAFPQEQESEGDTMPPQPAGSAEDVQAACLRGLDALTGAFAWVGPLLESALALPADARKPVHVVTAWGGCESPDHPDEEKHAAYVEHMLVTIQSAYPWLLPLLNSSRVGLWLEPGVCLFVTPTTGTTAIPIPQLVPLTRLTPFGAAEGESIH